MRLRKDPQAGEKLANYPFLITKFPVKLSSKDVLEVGMGKGEMIVALAAKNPQTFYYGIEKEPTVQLKAARKIAALKLNNVFLISGDAADLVDFFSGQCGELWLTFPDPWPKNRHYKRRLTYVSYLQIYKQLITPIGKLRFKTDNDKLFDFSVEQLHIAKAKINFQTRDLEAANLSDNTPTGYEKKWIAKGKNINYLEATFN